MTSRPVCSPDQALGKPRVRRGAAQSCGRSNISARLEKRAYILADNKLAEKAGWDAEILAIELQNLIDLDLDLDPISTSTSR